MNTILTITITGLTVILILSAIVQELWKRNRELKQKVEAFQIENENLQQNIAYLMKHTEEIQKIKKEADKISDKINGAKTDEEISDIVSAIISANNDRVQKQ